MISTAFIHCLAVLYGAPLIEYVVLCITFKVSHAELQPGGAELDKWLKDGFVYCSCKSRIMFLFSYILCLRLCILGVVQSVYLCTYSGTSPYGHLTSKVTSPLRSPLLSPILYSSAE